ncbi:MAG: formate-dependent phosphoribosylglycinamide formyltransferase [Alphaproteobacteria bacterium]|nr:formate-dependent phosphoribosylglycinamide formyltransferase [Alphaproteobacteria bacterium]
MALEPGRLGTALTSTATRVLFLGSGELGKEVVIELQRLGVEVIACDRYENAPAMQVAHRSHVFPMTDGAALRRVVEQERPDLIVPEIEAIATDTLAALEAEGFTVIPTARAAQLTMDREGIRRLAAEELGLRTSPYRFAGSLDAFRAAVAEIGLPCVVKPIQSSSGRGQSTVKTAADIDAAWTFAQEDARGGGDGVKQVIVEGFVDFDYEITLLTVRHVGGTSFCAPVGHRQEGGDYQESWQPQPMSAVALETAQQMAEAVTTALGGRGLFGVEFFIKDDTVWFSEVSPRPHDTGMVTLVSQDLSEFALHARAILGLPIPGIRLRSPGASSVILGHGDSTAPAFSGLSAALSDPDVQLRLFGKPELHGHRRLGVALAIADDVDAARDLANVAAAAVSVEL